MGTSLKLCDRVQCNMNMEDGPQHFTSWNPESTVNYEYMNYCCRLIFPVGLQKKELGVEGKFMCIVREYILLHYSVKLGA